MTNYELRSICYKAYQLHGDVLYQFITLLECRIDTLLYRTGLVTSIFEARQLINHNNVLVNNIGINKRSFVLRFNDFLSLTFKFLVKNQNRLHRRLWTTGITITPPAYLDVNYKIYQVRFLFDILKVNQIPFNFKLRGTDLNNLLYYYY